MVHQKFNVWLWGIDEYNKDEVNIEQSDEGPCLEMRTWNNITKMIECRWDDNGMTCTAEVNVPHLSVCLQGECWVRASRGKSAADWFTCSSWYLLWVLQDHAGLEICESPLTVCCVARGKVWVLGKYHYI